MEDGNRMKVPIEKVKELAGNPNKSGILENENRSHINGGYERYPEAPAGKDKLLNGQNALIGAPSKAASLKCLQNKSEPYCSLPVGDKALWQPDKAVNGNTLKKICNGPKATRLVKENGSREPAAPSAGAAGGETRRARKARPHAQYLGLQPTVKFKCNQCSCTSFGSIGMLKEHQRSCSSEVGRPLSCAPHAAPPPSNNNANFRISRKVYLCSACGTYYENWNLFLHIREVHDRHICLFCLGMFNRAQKLAAHLVIKHNVPENSFTSKEELASKFSQTFYLICCKCDKVFTERDDFVVHECAPGAASRPEAGRDSSRHKTQDNMKKASPSAETSADPDPAPCHPHAGDCVSLDCEENKPNKQIVTCEVEPTPEIPNISDSGVSNNPVCDNAPCKSSLLSDDMDISGHNKEQSKHNVSDGQILCKQPSGMDVLAGVISERSGDLLNDNETFKHLQSSTTINTPNIKDSVGMSVDSDLTGMDSLSAHWKPPARNRRPPKRYRLKDVETHDVEPIVTPPREMEVIKVPKLTVKLPKILPERISSSECSSESDDSDKLTVDCDTSRAGVGVESDVAMEDPPASPPAEPAVEPPVASAPELPLAGEEVPITELTLDRPLDKFPLEDLLRTLMAATAYNCIYCNHARKIAVVGEQLALHFLSQHRFSATVDSITAEELMPETFVGKIKSRLTEVHNVYLNMEGYSSSGAEEMKLYDHKYECFQCYFTTTLHKDLYLHNRKMHQKTILLCVMCKSNFYSYSELLCHLCPGAYKQDTETEMHFRCCLCPVSALPSAFRLMVHLRKAHHACDVCLDTCHSQARLSNHVWKHKLHHLCYRCGIAYRNKPDITKHLFWKHGTESVLCNKCLQKKWPHVYHFCVPPNAFVCEECDCSFSRAARLKVHKRLHSGDMPHACTWLDCTQRFISRRLLLRHEEEHNRPDPEPFLALDPPSVTDHEAKSEKHTIIDEIDLTVDKDETRPKVKKQKKSKKNKDKDNLLIDVNLPALNLSESDSSEDSEPEGNKKPEPVSDVVSTEEPPVVMPEFKEPELEPAPPVAGIWDNFKMYQAEIEKQNEKELPPVMKHVCDSDHDYCAIPSDELGYDKGLVDPSPYVSTIAEEKSYVPKEKKKMKSKKKAIKKAAASSSSDSSSESDSSCSCQSNCSCSSSSDSSSSSSSSSSSLGSRRIVKHPRRDSGDVDVVATEELPVLPPPVLAPPAPPPIAETDLDTTETETDEDFYDEHPQRSANRLLAEKRNRLMLLATVAPVNNGSHPDSSRPASPEEPAPPPEKRVKTKKKRKERKQAARIPSPPVQPPPPEVCQPNRIKISLQSNTVVLRDAPDDDSESKRASKRRRVPNRFYGYSSDEEFMPKAQMPPKLEWRKEDLPSRPVLEVAVPVPVRLPSPLPLPVEATSSDDDSSGSGALRISSPIPPQPPRPLLIRRQAREGESVYCYCKCPYDEVSEMIGCDAEGCAIEWFHFECVGIMVPPKGQWFCPDCRMRLEGSM